MVFVTHSVFESVYLSSRIVVMAARPGRVFTELAIDAPYPRDEDFRTSAEYAALCRRTSDALAQGHGGGRRTLDASAALRRNAATGCCASCCRSSCWRLSLAAWELVVRLFSIPPYVLPAPSLILRHSSPTERC